jgi:hypothetical protein
LTDFYVIMSHDYFVPENAPVVNGFPVPLCRHCGKFKPNALPQCPNAHPSGISVHFSPAFYLSPFLHFLEPMANIYDLFCIFLTFPFNCLFSFPSFLPVTDIKRSLSKYKFREAYEVAWTVAPFETAGLTMTAASPLWYWYGWYFVPWRHQR